MTIDNQPGASAAHPTISPAPGPTRPPSAAPLPGDDTAREGLRQSWVVRPLGLTAIYVGDEEYVYDPGSLNRWRADILSKPAAILAVAQAARPVARATLEACLVTHAACAQGEAPRIVDELIDAGLLSAVAGAALQRYREAERWESQGWRDALAYHWQTHRYPKRDYASAEGWADDCEMMRGFLAKEAQPPQTKSYPDKERVALAPAKLAAGRFERIFEAPGQGVATDGGPLSFSDFSSLVCLAFAALGAKLLAVSGRHLRRSSPSGGSRHPTEIYPIVNNVEGLSPGIYHFHTLDRCLERLSSGATERLIADHIVVMNDRVSFTPAVSLVLSSVFERSMYRYRESRSYRVIHMDIGHLLDTASSVCKWLDRPYYAGFSLNESEVDRALGLPSLSESAIAHLTVG